LATLDLNEHQSNWRSTKIIADSKPWKNFKEDLIKIEEEILVSHIQLDNLKKKQKKKIVRNSW
jgi:CRISPR-associated endonuclease Csn1